MTGIMVREGSDRHLVSGLAVGTPTLFPSHVLTDPVQGRQGLFS